MKPNLNKLNMENQHNDWNPFNPLRVIGIFIRKSNKSKLSEMIKYYGPLAERINYRVGGDY